MSMESVIERLDRLLAEKDRVLVAIDGNCGAGKTTLATRLAEHYHCDLFHMDDFFLRPEQRTAERYAQIGGNVDYERFAQEVLIPLCKGVPFSYRPFDCHTMTLSAPVSVNPGKLCIIEGSYSHHPYFENPYDLTIFLAASPELQRQRILQRPAPLHRRFFEEWIPMENRYFETNHIPRRADLIIQA